MLCRTWPPSMPQSARSRFDAQRDSAPTRQQRVWDSLARIAHGAAVELASNSVRQAFASEVLGLPLRVPRPFSGYYAQSGLGSRGTAAAPRATPSGSSRSSRQVSPRRRLRKAGWLEPSVGNPLESRRDTHVLTTKRGPERLDLPQPKPPQAWPRIPCKMTIDGVRH